MADFELIERASDLEALAKDLRREKVIAADTEADSFYHYFDKTCLLQIGTKKHSYLIDPLALGGPAELAPLGPVFADPKIRIIFHAAEYDLYVLKRDCGFEFAGLFDTMVSAQLLGYPSVGLAALVEHHFGVCLPKEQQRSDWSRRPLSDKQQTYAAADVQYLIQLTEKLERELKKASRLQWAQDEFDGLMRREWNTREFDQLGYLRIKGARKLDPKDLSVLRELYLTRDARAREVDRPPFKVLGNRTLIEIAETQPRSMEELSKIKGVTELILRRMGRDIMGAVRKGRKSAHGPIPKLDTGVRRRMDRRTERRLARLKLWRTEKAAALELDPGVLCPNAALEAIAWRQPETGKELSELAEVKPWFGREFGSEVAQIVGVEDVEEPPPERRSERRRRKR